MQPIFPRRMGRLRAGEPHAPPSNGPIATTDPGDLPDARVRNTGPHRPLWSLRPLQWLARGGGAAPVLLAGALVVAASSALAGSTFASFTRATSNAANTFTTATINLTAVPRQTAGGADNTAGNDIFSGTSSTTVTVGDVIPGDNFTRYLTLNNTGSVAADFSVTVTGSDNASSALVDGGAKSLKLQLQECTDNSFGSCATNVYHSGGNPTT
ncbi:MAG: hypothetical protein HY332_24795, partial [Chloroflexi bacterium]|nr:hypothetical protein [Chloroflexota bacterium]